MSGNARALPGLIIEANNPLAISKSVAIDWGIAQYFLNDDRYVENSKIHYKRLGLTWNINDRNGLNFKIQHFAVWGGTSPETGDLPDDFTAFTKVFLASRCNEDAEAGEQQNAIGNHLGSYLF
jgi:hypothetical protein